MTQRLSRSVVIALLSCVAMGQDVYADARQTKVNPDAQVLAEFKANIDAYMKLHERLQKESPPLVQTKDPAKIQAAQNSLASKIQDARKSAKPGDIFTPRVRELFRRLMYPEVRGPEGKETKESMKEDAPKGVPLRVNAKYPDNAPLPTVPPNLLAALPRLPEDLEYRFINRDLILHDVDANLIVDFIPGAIR